MNAELARRIRLVVLDVDGVLTDGKEDLAGGEKNLFLRDIDALTFARGNGIKRSIKTRLPFITD